MTRAASVIASSGAIEFENTPGLVEETSLPAHRLAEGGGARRNDGIASTASLIVGVTSAATRNEVAFAVAAGLIASSSPIARAAQHSHTSDMC